MQNIKFKDVKGCISRIDPISICLRDAMDYETYKNINGVEVIYDEYYVHGIGIVGIDNPDAIGMGHFRGMGLEIMLAETPPNIS